MGRSLVGGASLEAGHASVGAGQRSSQLACEQLVALDRRPLALQVLSLMGFKEGQPACEWRTQVGGGGCSEGPLAAPAPWLLLCVDGSVVGL